MTELREIAEDNQGLSTRIDQKLTQLRVERKKRRIRDPDDSWFYMTCSETCDSDCTGKKLTIRRESKMSFLVKLYNKVILL